MLDLLIQVTNAEQRLVGYVLVSLKENRMNKFLSVIMVIVGFILAVLGSIATLISAICMHPFMWLISGLVGVVSASISGYGIWTVLGYGLGFAVATPILGLVGVLLGMLAAFIGALIVESA